MIDNKGNNPLTRRTVLQIVTAITLLVALLLISNSGRFDHARHNLQTRSIEQSLLDRGGLGKGLREAGLIRLEQDHHYANDGDHQNASWLSFQISLDQPANFMLFWAGESEDFTIQRSHRIDMPVGTRHYRLGFPQLETVSLLRIDFVDLPQSFQVSELKLESAGLHSLSMTWDTIDQATVSTRQLEVVSEANGIRHYSATGKDPQLILSIGRLAIKPDYFAQLFIKRDNRTARFYGPNQGEVDSGLDQSIADFSRSSDFPVIHAQVDERDLTDPDHGLLMNRHQSGSEWEKDAWINYYESGSALASTAAGIRFHGGTSRDDHESFRLYFGKRRGSGSIGRNRIFDNRVSLRTLVVRHNEWPKGMPLNTVLGYEVCRLLGCDTPEFRLAHFFLNDQYKGIYTLIEHQSWRQWNGRNDQQVAHLFKYKSDNSDADINAYTGALESAGIGDEMVRMNKVGQVFDLEQLTLHVLAQFYTANGDYCQGIAIQDADSGLWRYVAWDMDHGFSYQPDRPDLADRPAWREVGFAKMYTRGHKCARTVLVKKLLEDDEAYRDYFKKTLESVLDRELHPDTLKPIVDGYILQLASAGNPNTQNLKSTLYEFIEKRPAYLINEFNTLFYTHSTTGQSE